MIVVEFENRECVFYSLFWASLFFSLSFCFFFTFFSLFLLVRFPRSAISFSFRLCCIVICFAASAWTLLRRVIRLFLPLRVLLPVVRWICPLRFSWLNLVDLIIVNRHGSSKPGWCPGQLMGQNLNRIWVYPFLLQTLKDLLSSYCHLAKLFSLLFTGESCEVKPSWSLWCYETWLMIHRTWWFQSDPVKITLCIFRRSFPYILHGSCEQREVVCLFTLMMRGCIRRAVFTSDKIRFLHVVAQVFKTIKSLKLLSELRLECWTWAPPFAWGRLGLEVSPLNTVEVGLAISRV